jgi:hypothetical protein
MTTKQDKTSGTFLDFRFDIAEVNSEPKAGNYFTSS